MNQTVRAQALMPPQDAGGFDSVCQNGRHKKLTLMAWPILKYLKPEGYGRETVRQKRSA